MVPFLKLLDPIPINCSLVVRRTKAVTTLRFSWILANLFAVLMTPTLSSSQTTTSATQNGNSCLSVIGSIGKSGLSEMRASVRQLQKKEPLQADLYFKVAELMRRTGDYRATEYYERAVQADPSEPCYEAFLGDYLRNFRGATSPLFPQAEKHYFEGLKKLRVRHDDLYRDADKQTRDYIDRGLSALYQQDGLMLFARRSEIDSTNGYLNIPLAFFSSTERYQQSTSDLDREADIRDYTSEALFSESAQRLDRPLTQQELAGLIRIKRAAETQNRITLHYKSMPEIDVFYTHRQTADEQISNFFVPDKFNDLRLSTYGLTLQKPFSVGDYFDAFIEGRIELDQRWGLIEFAPGSEERILNYQTKGAISRFIGPDKATAEFTFAHQSIHPEIVPASPDRYRQFVGTRFTYSIFRRLPLLQDTFKKRFETRGIDLFSGFLNDTESFPPVLVSRHDYFVGVSLKGLWRFDFTLQPTWFTSSVSNDLSQHNGQYRTNFTTLLRLVDEERNDGIPSGKTGLHLAFVHLVVPFRRDSAFAGPKFFENSRVGVGLNTKLFTYARWATFLLSARYDHQHFAQPDKGKNIFTVTASLGF